MDAPTLSSLLGRAHPFLECSSIRMLCILRYLSFFFSKSACSLSCFLLSLGWEQQCTLTLYRSLQYTSPVGANSLCPPARAVRMAVRVLLFSCPLPSTNATVVGTLWCTPSLPQEEKRDCEEASSPEHCCLCLWTRRSTGQGHSSLWEKHQQ